MYKTYYSQNNKNNRCLTIGLQNCLEQLCSQYLAQLLCKQTNISSEMAIKAC